MQLETIMAASARDSVLRVYEPFRSEDLHKRPLFISLIFGFLLVISCLCASAATRDPVFSVPSGTTFSAPHQVAISVPFNGEVRYTRDGTTPSGGSTLYTGPLTIRWTETVKAIAIVNSVSSNVVTASYTLSSTKFPAPSAGGTTAPVINVQLPTTGQ